MGENSWGQPQPAWQFRNQVSILTVLQPATELRQGREILQMVNSAPGIAVGAASLAGLDWEGTFYVGPHQEPDNDFLGLIFSFQVNMEGEYNINGILIRRITLILGTFY